MKEFDWIGPTLERISDLLKMPDKHNSHGTPEVDPSSAWTAIRMLWEANVKILPMPYISPTSAGGLNLMWYGLETECSLTVSPITEGIFKTDISSRKGALVRNFGEFSCAERNLQEALTEISKELTPEVPAP